VIPEAMIRAKRVILETDPRLISVFERSFGIECVPANIVTDERGKHRKKKEHPKEVTSWMSLGDLPRMFRTDLSHFPGKPYIKPDPKQVERFKEFKGRTGISWRGSQGSYKPGDFQVENPLSLQYDQDWEEEVEKPDLDLRNDVEGILGLLANLTRVVSVSTSVAHFAGSMGVPLDVVLADPKTSKRGNILPFKWGGKEKTPWYGSATVYQTLGSYRARPKSSR